MAASSSSQETSELVPGYIDVPTKIGPLPGSLSFVEKGAGLPFDIKRVYWIYDVPEGEVRGFHAHFDLQQLLFAFNGKIEISIESVIGKKDNFLLDDPSRGLFLPPVHWRTLRFQDPGAILMCFASHEYSEADYVRDYGTFQALQKQ